MEDLVDKSPSQLQTQFTQTPPSSESKKIFTQTQTPNPQPKQPPVTATILIPPPPPLRLTKPNPTIQNKIIKIPAAEVDEAVNTAYYSALAPVFESTDTQTAAARLNPNPTTSTSDFAFSTTNLLPPSTSVADPFSIQRKKRMLNEEMQAETEFSTPEPSVSRLF